MARRWSRLAVVVLGPLAGFFLRLYFLTIRIVDEPRSAAFRRASRKPGGLYVLWHSHQLAGIWHYRDCGVAVLASRHRDAEYPARAAASLGYIVVRGSSTRGGLQAYRELRDLARQGRPIALTPDGPRGPRHAVKAGIIHLARDTGVPVTPLAIGFSSFWTLPTWDGFRIPKPFSRGYALWGEAVQVPPEASSAEMERACRYLEEQLLHLEAEADRRARVVGCPPKK